MDRVDLINSLEMIARGIQTMPGTFQRMKSLRVNIAANGDVHASVSTEAHLFLRVKDDELVANHDRSR